MPVMAPIEKVIEAKERAIRNMASIDGARSMGLIGSPRMAVPMTMPNQNPTDIKMIEKTRARYFWRK